MRTRGMAYDPTPVRPARDYVAKEYCPCGARRFARAATPAEALAILRREGWRIADGPNGIACPECVAAEARR